MSLENKYIYRANLSGSFVYKVTATEGDFPVGDDTVLIKNVLLGGGNNLILDLIPGAVGAYSIYKLSTPYTGSGVTVQRDSDSATTTLGFDADGFPDYNSISAWCSGTNTHIIGFFDQSGFGRHISVYAGATGAKIHDSSTGFLIEDGLLRPDSGGVAYYDASAVTLTQPCTILNSFKTTTGPFFQLLHDGHSGGSARIRYNVGSATGTSNGIFAGSTLQFPNAHADNTHYITISLYDDTASTSHRNGVVEVSGSVGTNDAGSGLTLGASTQGINSSLRSTQKQDTWIFWDGDQSTLFASAMNSINDYVGAY